MICKPSQSLYFVFNDFPELHIKVLFNIFRIFYIFYIHINYDNHIFDCSISVKCRWFNYQNLYRTPNAARPSLEADFLLSRNFPALRDVSKIHLRAGLPPSELFLCSQVINTDKRMAREQNLNRRYGRTATEDLSNDTSALKPYILVAIAAIACYLNSLFGEFVYDDFEVIETNADVR